MNICDVWGVFSFQQNKAKSLSVHFTTVCLAVKECWHQTGLPAVQTCPQCKRVTHYEAQNTTICNWSHLPSKNGREFHFKNFVIGAKHLLSVVRKKWLCNTSVNKLLHRFLCVSDIKLRTGKKAEHVTWTKLGLVSILRVTRLEFMHFLQLSLVTLWI